MLAAEFDVLSLPQDVAEMYRRLRPGTVVAQFEYPGYGHVSDCHFGCAREPAETAQLRLQ